MKRLFAAVTAGLLCACAAACAPADTSSLIASQIQMSTPYHSAVSSEPESVEQSAASLEISSAASSQTASQSSSKTSSAASSRVSSAASSKASSAVSSKTVGTASSQASSVVSSAPSSVVSSSASSTASSAADPGVTLAGELRGAWVSFYELTDIQTFEIFKTRIDAMFDMAAELGFNAIFMHVRSHGDAFYRSSIFPMTARIGFTDEKGNRIQGIDPGYDPLEYAVAAAHARGLQLHAWINPYRVWTLSGDINDLAENNPARMILQDDDPGNDEAVIVRESSIFYNPASRYARELIVAGITEIVQNYAVDGVHFDDYFYPTSEKSFDKTSYDAYLNSGGRLELDDWRRENVSKLVQAAYTAVKAVRDIPFGISPAGNIDKVVNEEYADVRLWGGTAGYVDYLCPQVYWGFEHRTFPFEATVQDWLAVVTEPGVDIYIGLPAYKLGQTDDYAGSGKSEFKTQKQIIARMVDCLRAAGCDGYAVYNLSSITDSANAAEAAALAERAK